ncbi:hypothetical protein [Nesterenkonia populi]
MTTVKEKTRTPDTGFPDVEALPEGAPNPRCQWYYGVCTDAATHHITRPAVGDEEPEANTYCQRHWVLQMARDLEVHMPTCTGTVDSHYAGYGPIGGT